MAGQAFISVAVPATTDGVLGIIKVGGKVGKIQLSFLSQAFRDTLGHTVAGHDLWFRIFESSDRGGADAWNELTVSGGVSAPIKVKPGGQEIASIATNKDYIQIRGHGIGGGGYCKIDAMFNGMQFFGQVDFDVVGKSGFGLDGDAPVVSTLEGEPRPGSVNAAGTSEYGAASWPVPPAP